MSDAVCAVVVTHRRHDELSKSLEAVSAQTRTPDHLIVERYARVRQRFRRRAGDRGADMAGADNGDAFKHDWQT